MHLISEISKIFGSQSVVSILNLVERDGKIFLYDYIKNYINNVNLISKEDLENKAIASINELKKRYENN